MSLKFTDLRDLEEVVNYKRYENIETWRRYINDKQHEIDIVHLNIRSLRKNFGELLVLINNCLGKLDVIILSEINIKRDELSFYAINGYNLYANTRENKRGGGVLMYIKENINCEVETADTTASEVLHGKLQINGKLLHLIAVYRPPNSNKLRFLKETNILIKNIQKNESIVIVGDMNLNLLGTQLNSTLMK